MIIEKVQANRAAARKDVARVIEFNILTLLVGEMETAVKREGKTLSAVSDEDVTKVIKKLIKSNNEVITAYGELGSQKFIKENEVLSAYLPEELSDVEVHAFLTNTVFGSIGEAIKALDAVHKGRYDRASASKIAKELL